MSAAQHTPGMVQTTKAAFFAAMGPRNVHPHPEREHCVWIDQNNRSIAGISTPGFMCQGAETFAISAAIAKATGQQGGAA